MRGWFQKKPDEPDWSLISGINFRKAAFAAVTLAALGVTGWQGYRHYLVWHEQHLVIQAHQFAGKADFRSSVLSARQALELNPTNLAATRLMAELADQTRAPAAVSWRARLDELEPHRLENQLAWAATALWSGELSIAHQALEKVDAAGRLTAEYNRTMAAWAVQAKQFGLAERHYLPSLRWQGSCFHRQSPYLALPWVQQAVQREDRHGDGRQPVGAGQVAHGYMAHRERKERH